MGTSTPTAGQAPAPTTRRPGRFVTGLLVGVVAGALLAWSGYWLLQRTVILHDDTGRGERFAEVVNDAFDGDEGALYSWCELAAEAFYGHPMFDSQPGWAPRSEKAFYKGCSGGLVGGLGY